jgi:hypothetical protein
MPSGCNPPGAVSRSWWGVPRVSAAWMLPSSLHGGIHGVPWRDPPRPNLTHRGRRVTPMPSRLILHLSILIGLVFLTALWTNSDATERR